MKYKYILFDWDGTLAKTLDVWIMAYRKISEELKIDINNFSDNEIVQTFFGKEADGFKKFGIENVGEVYGEIKKFVDANVVHVEIYKNVNEILDKLKGIGYKLALHTSSNRNLLYPAIVNKDLEKYFDLILTRDDVKKPKPDPEVIYKELEFFKANKSEAIIVGDSNSDVMAGKNAGIKTVCFYPEENKKFYSESDIKSYNADYIIHDLLEILDIIK